jgi:hypothetical protein
MFDPDSLRYDPKSVLLIVWFDRVGDDDPDQGTRLPLKPVDPAVGRTQPVPVGGGLLAVVLDDVVTGGVDDDGDGGTVTVTVTGGGDGTEHITVND